MTDQRAFLCGTPKAFGGSLRLRWVLHCDVLHQRSRALSVPFDLCGSSGCSGPLKSHLSLKPGYCKILFPSHPGLASPHQPRLLIQTFKNENQTKTAFFYFSFSDFTLTFFRIMECKESLYFKYPLICTLTSGEESVRENVRKFSGC